MTEGKKMNNTTATENLVKVIKYSETPIFSTQNDDVFLTTDFKVQITIWTDGMFHCKSNILETFATEKTLAKTITIMQKCATAELGA